MRCPKRACDAQAEVKMQSLQRSRPSVMDCVGTVLASVQLTPTIKSIWLRLDQTEFSFLPGQSIWPCFEREGRQFKKIYSIASSPSCCPEVELCVSRVGWSSAYLQDLAVGATIRSRGPYGLMILDCLPFRPRIYVAEGSGIAPLKSQIDWLHDQGFDRPVWLIQANPETPDRLPYADYWRSLTQTWHSFHYVESTCLERTMAAQPIDWAQFDVEICGVNHRPVQLQQAALALGAKLEQIRFEKFVAF